MSGEPAKMITMNSSDGHTFLIEETIASQSKTLELMIAENETETVVIPLHTITGSILVRVIEYCYKHAEVETSDDDKRLWDEQFVNSFSRNILFDIILAANFLNIGCLLELTCRSVSDIIKDKSVEEVREIFSIENDYTPEEEEEKVRKQNQWAFE